MDVLRGIRPADYALTAVLVALAAALGVANVTMGAHSADLAHQLDSQSPLLIPVFMAAAAPALWRRRNVLGAIGVSFLIVAASVPAFGWVTRCGFALPLSFALAYAVARFAVVKRNHVLGLVGILALQVASLVRDASTGGLGALALSIPLALLSYGIGSFVQSRSGKAVEQAAQLSERLYA
ncbi:MAG: hypothetical protein NVS3B26_21180 [Mycobacteriales bacterium]